jgi:hypothetical protein
VPWHQPRLPLLVVMTPGAGHVCHALLALGTLVQPARHKHAQLVNVCTGWYSLRGTDTNTHS